MSLILVVFGIKTEYGLGKHIPLVCKQSTSSGVGLILIEPTQLSYFNRDMLHGYPDDFERFSYFSRASLDYIIKSGKQPDILHIHNWETAIVAPLFWDIFAHQGLENTRVLLTCQDLDSQVNIQYNSFNRLMVNHEVSPPPIHLGYKIDANF